MIYYDIQAVDVLLDAVQSESCDVINKWAGLQCLVESGACEVCVVEGLQKYLLNSSQSSRRERAGQLMAKLSDRMVSHSQFPLHSALTSPPYSL